jgi:hypothetical protein
VEPVSIVPLLPLGIGIAINNVNSGGKIVT